MITQTMQPLKEALSRFNDKEPYYKHTIAGKLILLYTEGVKFLAEQTCCYWLLDLILSWQLDEMVMRKPLQQWVFYKTKTHWVVKCKDDNGNVLATQQLKSMDFPLSRVELNFTKGVLRLPSENYNSPFKLQL